ncbi:hypothetical protein ASY01nite_20960 [Acetobacter syzygii]|nr:hypothetical protein ASY01nite_20960 [Acetobacter syzygii]
MMPAQNKNSELQRYEHENRIAHHEKEAQECAVAVSYKHKIIETQDIFYK